MTLISKPLKVPLLVSLRAQRSSLLVTLRLLRAVPHLHCGVRRQCRNTCTEPQARCDVESLIYLARVPLSLAEPLEDVLYFAGEATHREDVVNVHGAYISGVAAAEEIGGLGRLSNYFLKSRCRLTIVL